jgi:uncharacterized protein YbaR (Trm112 family)
MTATQEQLDELGRRYHREDVVACPLCQAQLSTLERGYSARISVPVRFVCPLHGILGDSDPPDLRVPWADDHVRQMVADHLRRKDARCPEDQARVGVILFSNETGTYLHLACPSCGRLREGPYTIEN